MKTHSHFSFSCENDTRGIYVSYLSHILVILYSLASAYTNYCNLDMGEYFVLFFLYRELKYLVDINAG